MCGLPVITSNVSSMPEFGGEAVVYVDPENASEMERVIWEIMGDDGLREEMIKQGISQAKKFSWEKCAEETAKVYRKMTQ